MKDRFKFRFWHTPSEKMLDCYGFNEHYTFADTLDGIGTEYNPCKTSDCVLMQCTGLRDKNGKLIYEGDILWILCTESHIGVVCWDNEKAYYRINGKGVAYNVLQVLHSEFAFEVIGNIYENPELLEVDNANI